MVDGVAGLGALIETLKLSQAIALGGLRADLPDKVDVTTLKKLRNGTARVDLIARTNDNIVYDGPAFVLLDFDTKGMPPSVAAELERHGGFWPALLTVLPALAKLARLTRSSTSAGLSRTDTGAAIPGSDGVHVYIIVKDGADAVRFLEALHDRCWLAGLGWMMDRRRRTGAGAIDRRPLGRAVRAPGVRERPGAGAAAGAGQGEAPAGRGRMAPCSTPWRRARRCRSSSRRGSRSSRPRTARG